MPTRPGLTLPQNAFDRNNAVSVFLMGALPAVAGSAISFLLGMFFVWGAISLALRRFEFRMTQTDRLLAWTFTFFVVSILVTGLLGDAPLEVFRSVWLLPYLSLWVVIPRLRASPGVDYLRFYIVGAAVGAAGALLFAVVETQISAARPEGGAGNAAVFAMMCLALAGIAGLNIDAASRRLRLLATAALIAGLAAVILSLTRGVALVSLAVLALLAVYANGRLVSIARQPAFLVAAALAGLMLYGGWGALEQRFDTTVAEMERVLSGEHSDSIGERLRLWRAAVPAILESPLWGHGIQNRMAVLEPVLIQDGLQVRGFTHAHNTILTFLLDGGVVALAAVVAVLAMPVMIAARAPADARHRQRLFLALILVTIYTLCGMTQIMFKHDIMDSFYIFTAILVAVSIPDPERPPQE